MSLFQMTIKRDQDWDTLNELFKLDFIHYIDINAHIQPHQLLFAEYIRKCDETFKRIAFCEDMFKRYDIEMRQPESLDQMNQVMAKIQQNKRKAANQLLPEIELEMVKQERFVREQNKLIENAIKSFRTMIAQINILKAVARVMGVA